MSIIDESKSIIAALWRVYSKGALRGELDEHKVSLDSAQCCFEKKNFYRLRHRRQGSSTSLI
jgi:hypothetical protein